jgi:transposase
MTLTIRRVSINMKELEEHLERARVVLGEEGYDKLKAALETLQFLTGLIEDKETTINRLRQIIFGASTEKTSNVLQDQPESLSSQDGKETDQKQNPVPAGGDAGEKETKKRKGHGRNGAKEYTGAKKVKVSHESLKSGDPCPLCKKGKIYALKVPSYIVRLVGQAPIGGTVYELETLRCNLCLEVFTAQQPEGVGPQKYDETSGSMIGLLRYGAGFPFHRLERLQGNVGMPLPASTQWEIVSGVATRLKPAFGELIRQGAQGEVLHNDDTIMKILQLMKENRSEQTDKDPKMRTGIFTTGIVSLLNDRKIALFFTGRNHAGENLADVLAKRAVEIGPPIQMCDALSRNLPKAFQTILGNCNAHARRGFVEVAHRFPDECRHVLETFRDVYQIDALAGARGMSAEERLALHQAESGPLMEKLKAWLREQLDEKNVEPNSALGDAISYVIDHWEPLTLFLRVAGAPLDNNICYAARGITNGMPTSGLCRASRPSRRGQRVSLSGLVADAA